MPGAAALVASGALRSGAGMVHVSSPGAEWSGQLPVEVVQRPLPVTGWADEALRSVDRFHAVVLGPGLGRTDDTAAGCKHCHLDRGIHTPPLMTARVRLLRTAACGGQGCASIGPADLT